MIYLCYFFRYRSINMEGKAFKSKLATILGPLPLLKALGFEKVEGESGEAKLQLNYVNNALFASTVAKLIKADEMYSKSNGL